MRHDINRIQNKDLNIGSYRIYKTYLRSYDDKKYIRKDGYHSRLTYFLKSPR